MPPTIKAVSGLYVPRTPLPPIHGMGWRRPLPGVGASLPEANLSGLTVKDEVDPRPSAGGKMQGIDDQGQAGTCTADSTCNVFRYDAILDGKDPGPLSRLWVYRYERKLEGTFEQGDVGAMGHDAYRVAAHGIPPESLWSYATTLTALQAPPPKACLPVAARAYWLKKPVHIVPQDELAMKAVLSNHQTISYGFSVYQSYEQIGPDGIMPIPDPNYEQLMGGHEQVIVGYLRAFPDYALVRGSWSTAFALAGYVLFPWSVLLNPNMASDFRTIVRPLGQ